MKRLTILMVAVALVCFSVPAMAVDWNFYGSARVNTWYVSTDLGDTENVAGDDGDAEVRWGFNGQTNSRIGAKVKADGPVEGRFEIQMKGNGAGDPSDYVSVESRIIYGQWDFGAGKLKVGKDYTPVSQFISGQVFDEDLGLLGIGTQYGNRTPGLFFTFGGFQIALLEPNTNDITTNTGVSTGGDIDSYIPKLEASWGMSFDAFNFNLEGGYQYYSIKTPVANGGKDIDVTSYTIGGDAGFNFGPGYVKGSVAYGQNWGPAAWGLNGAYTQGSNAVWKGGTSSSIDDTTSYMFALAAGLKMSDMLSFEVGGGWRKDDPDAEGWDDQTAWSVYGQAVVAMAPGVYIVPEVGYFDFGDLQTTGDDAGSEFYLGAKWQIDF
jgi:hypothetical protein